MKPIIYIILFLISFNGVSQIFSDAQLYQIDSLNAVINNPKSHDTSLAGSYVTLSEILYISSIDTLKYLCEKAKIIAETSLLNDNPEKIQKSLRESLARALNNIGYINYSKEKGGWPYKANHLLTLLIYLLDLRYQLITQPKQVRQ